LVICPELVTAHIHRGSQMKSVGSLDTEARPQFCRQIEDFPGEVGRTQVTALEETIKLSQQLIFPFTQGPNTAL